MDFLNELETLRQQTENFHRARLPFAIEKKIRDNVFEIFQKMYHNVGMQKLLQTSQLMYQDWSRAYSEDIRFGRQQEADKAMIKLATFEWILSLPSLKKERDHEPC